MLEVNNHPFPVLETERLILRQKTEADAPELFDLRSNKRVLQYLDRDPPGTVEEIIALIQTINTDVENGNAVAWAITVKGDPKLVGSVAFWRMQKAHFRAELGYLLHPDFHRQGIMDEALKAVIRYGFEVMGLHSMEANVNPANQASIGLLEKNGFKKEAHFTENYYAKGKFLDSAIYSLVLGW